jgi:hypothetical protein
LTNANVNIGASYLAATMIPSMVEGQVGAGYAQD